jgi:hypothetical protein
MIKCSGLFAKLFILKHVMVTQLCRKISRSTGVVDMAQDGPVHMQLWTTGHNGEGQTIIYR